MKTKTKKIIYKISKIIWFLIGGFILLWTGFFFVKMYTIQDLGVLAGVVLFAAGIYMLMVYIVITLLFILIKWLIKRFRKKK